MFLMTASKNGVSAKELERQLGVTYKCAWRIAHQIRQLLAEETPMLKGVVEADETYIGGRTTMAKRSEKKTPIIGILEREGDVIAKVVPKASRRMGFKRKSRLVPPLNWIGNPLSARWAAEFALLQPGFYNLCTVILRLPA